MFHRRPPMAAMMAAPTARETVPWMVALLIMIAMTIPAQAARVDFQLHDNPDNQNAAEFDVWVDITSSGDDWLMLFHNDSNADFSLTEVWFEVGFRDQLLVELGPNSRDVVDTFGVDFELGNTDPALPPDEDQNLDWRGNAFSFSAEDGADEFENGVNSDPSEVLLTRINKTAFSNLTDMLNALNNQGTRIAVLLEDAGVALPSQVALTTAVAPVGGDDPDDPPFDDDPFDDDPFDDDPFDENFDRSPEPVGGGGQTPIAGPTPAAIWPGLAILGALTMRRKRKQS